MPARSVGRPIGIHRPLDLGPGQLLGFSSIPAGVVQEITFSSTGTGTSSFALNAQRALAITSTGTGTSAFALKAKRALGFASTGSGTSSAALRATRALAFTSTGTGTSAFGIKAKRALAFSSTGSGTSSFALNRLRSLNWDESQPMLTGALDDFNTGASQNLTSRTGIGWSVLTLRTGEATYATDSAPTYAVGPSGSAGNGWATQFAADMEAWVTFKTVPGTDFNIYVRIPVANGITPATGYVLNYTKAGDLWRIFTSDFGTQIGGSPSQVISIGDSFGLSVRGTTLTGWYRAGAGPWTSIVTGTNATFGGPGYIGFDTADGSTSQIDAFGGGVLVPSGGTGTSTFAFTISAGIKEITFSSTGTGTSAFALTRKRALAFTSTGTGTSAFALKAKRALSFASTGTGTSAFALKAKRALSFTSTGVGTSSFGIVNSSANLKQLTFDERGSGAYFPDDFAGPDDLVYPDGFTGGVGTSSFTLHEKASLSFSSTGSGTSSFGIKAKRALSFSSTGAGTTSFALARRRPLAFSSTGTGTSAFSIKAKRALAFSSTGTGTSTFTINVLTPLKQLSFSSTGTGTSSFTLKAKHALSFASTGTSTSAFGVNRKRSLNFTSTGVGTSSWTLHDRRAISFNSTGVGATTFTLTARRALTFTSTGVGTSNFTAFARVSPTVPGGGGFGAVMSDDFFKRYQPRYKPTLRKQKV